MRGFLCSQFLVLSLICANHAAAATLKPGDIQPDFTLPKFNFSQQVNLHNDLAGKILVFDFFAYWCGPCNNASSELEPYVQQYYDTLGGNPAHLPVQLVSLDVDGSNTSETQMYINNYGLQLVLNDSSWNLYDQYSTGAIPQFAIVDGVAGTNHKQWEVLWTQTGYGSGGYADFRDVIDTVVMVPEPGALTSLIAGGLAAAGWMVWRRRARKEASHVLRHDKP
jgi:thiol-disulfide isomerase/thioredoxin